MLHNYFKCIVTIILLIISGCSVQNNVQMTVNNGNCNDGYTNAPYCVSVTVNNNTDGQNYINSANFSISDLKVFLNSPYNISYPSSAKSMDPNNCTNKTISPGSGCTFYLAINTESYPVASNQLINVTLKYVINNNLFGGGGQNASSSFNLTESTNLYIVSNQDGSMFSYVNIYNNNGLSKPYIGESVSDATSVAIDNNSYGYLYIATKGDMFYYGNEFSALSKMPDGVTGLNNLITSYLSPQTIGNAPTNMYGVASNIYSFTFKDASWGKSLVADLTGIKNNISAVSPLGNVFLTNGNGTNLLNCSLNNSANNCIVEGVLQNISGMVHATLKPNGYTGLYVIANNNNDLLVESDNKIDNMSTWINVTAGESNLSNIIAVTNNSKGSIYAGDSQGQIWQITSQTPTVATKLGDITTSIQQNGMIYDNFADILYVVSNTNLYKCNTNPSFSCSKINGNIANNTIIKMAIGSSLGAL